MHGIHFPVVPAQAGTHKPVINQAHYGSPPARGRRGYGVDIPTYPPASQHNM